MSWLAVSSIRNLKNHLSTLQPKFILWLWWTGEGPVSVRPSNITTTTLSHNSSMSWRLLWIYGARTSGEENPYSIFKKWYPCLLIFDRTHAEKFIIIIIIQTCLTFLKNWPCVTSYSYEEIGKFVFKIKIGSSLAVSGKKNAIGGLTQ